MMRVITGIARGKKLKTLDGIATRPTTERVKEAVFSSLFEFVNGAKVLDLFAGSGQMGIESVSRGADYCTFVEQGFDALRIIRENVKMCGFDDKSAILQKDVKSFVSSTKEKYDLIFMDPPYGKGLVTETMDLISKYGLLSDNGIIVAESDSVDLVDDRFGNLELYKTGKYGRTVVRYFRNNGENI